MAEEHNTSGKYTVSPVIDNDNHNTNLNPPTPTINGKRSLSTTWLDEWKAQIDALLMKHVLVLSRKICAVLLLVFLPCIFVIILSVTNSAVLNGHRAKPFEPLIQLKPTQCVVLNNQHMVDHQNPSCITIMYGPSTTVTDDIMNIFVNNENKQNNNHDNAWKIKVGVDRSSDIIFPTGERKYRDLEDGADVVGMKNNIEISKFMRNHLGGLDAVLFFDIENDPTGATYTLMVNATKIGGYSYWLNHGWQDIALQNNINEAIIVHKNGGDHSKIDLQVSISPIVDYDKEERKRSGNADDMFEDVVSVVPSAGPIQLVLGPVIAAMLIIDMITAEKRARLLGYMRMMGLHEGAYWISWMIVIFVISFVSALVAAIGGTFTDIYLFKNCDLGVHFVAWFFFLTSMHSMGLFLSSVVTRRKWVNLVEFFLMGFVIIFISMITIARPANPFWNDAYSVKESMFWKFIFFMMPWFHYIRIFNNILTVTKVQGLGMGETRTMATPASASSSTSTTNTDGNNTVQKNVTANSTYYKWDMIYDKIGKPNGEPFDEVYDINGDVIGGKWWSPSIHDEMMYMFALTFIYIALAWYFAQILGGELGAAKKKFFCVSYKYWACLSKKLQHDEEEEEEETFIDGDRVNEEKVKSKKENSLRVYNMSKSFKNVTALKELSLTMKNNQVFCLLGHNGAGKTTAINCLTGLHNLTNGEVFIFGKSIKEEMTQVQKLMGVCPQHDVLFAEMTAKEHLRFWARFKGVQRNQLDAHVRQTLVDISLEGKGNILAATFSGGMKRRLSVGMSAMGHPKVIFLDEPTTGLDPLSRRRIWKMIERLKVGRIIVLTTHSMEEADALSDEIAILSAGRLRAFGTSFFLKNKFGSGYSISLMCNEKNTGEVIKFVNQKLPGAETLANAAGALTFGLPKRVMPLIPGFFKYIEAEAQKYGKNALVKEWGISNTTLEEVFLRLIAQTKEVNANTGGNTGGLGGEDAVVLHTNNDLPSIKANDEEREFQPINLYSTTGAPVVISDQLYRIAGRTLTDEIETAEKSEEMENKVEEESGELETLDENATEEENKESHPDLKSSKFASEKQGTFKQQIKAFVCKDYSILKKNKYSNYFRLFVIIGTTFAMIIIQLIATGDMTYLKRQTVPGICKAGLNFVAEGAGALSRSFDLCNATDWHDYILGGKCKYRGDCSLYRNTSVYIEDDSSDVPSSVANRSNSSGGRLLHEIPHSHTSGGSITAMQYQGVKQLQKHSMYPDFCVLTNTEIFWDDRGREKPEMVRLWIENKDSVVQPISMNALGNIHNGNNIFSAMPLYFDVNFNDMLKINTAEIGDADRGWDREPRFGEDGGIFDRKRHQYQDKCLGINISHYINIPSVLKENQYKIRAQGIPFEKFKCKDDIDHDDIEHVKQYYGDMGREEEEKDMAINAQAKLFPDYAITFEQVKASGTVKQKNLDLQLKYTIHMFTLHDHEPHKQYKSTSIIYTQTDEEHTHSECALVKPIVFVPSIYYHWGWWQLTRWSNIPGYRRRGPLTIQQIFLSTHILNSALYDNYKRNNPAENEQYDLQINSQITAMPLVRFINNPYYGVMLYSLLSYFPIMTMLVFPGIVNNVGMELREKLVHSIRGQNGSLVAYWTAVYVFHYTVYSAFTTAFVTFQYLIGTEPILNCNFGQLFAILIVWGHAQIGMGIFLSMVLRKTRLEVLSAYIIMLIIMVAVPVLRSAQIIKWPYFLWLFPPTAFARSLSLVMEGAAQPHTIVTATLSMLWTSTLLGLIGIYIHYQSLYEDTGNSISKYILNNILCKCRKKNNQISHLKSTTGEASKGTDSDVLEEEERASALNKTDIPVKIVGLRKIFQQVSPPKVAVDGITFAIDYNEVFGLLGPNGAGKTTSIHILSGNTKATSGNAFIGGFDVTDRNNGVANVRKIIGLCPQFDIVWPTMTVEEHLIFYARLRGVKKIYENAVAQDVAGQVELAGDEFHMQASKLSGGMKRRLSIGIAIVGDPNILFFDEPTTGLDPETRLGVWRIIEKQSKGKAIILTTHSMEEADALSTRIGIMAYGRLQCVGTQLHLKNKYGSGYKLIIVLKSDADVNEADSFVKTVISNKATRMLTEEHAANAIIYSIMDDNIKISTIFEHLQDQRKTFLAEWSLQQTTLESVFLKIALEAEEKEGEGEDDGSV